MSTTFLATFLLRLVLAPPSPGAYGTQTLLRRSCVTDFLRSVLKVRIEFLKEQQVFTGEASPLANLMLSVMGAFAEFERALNGERQHEGITRAKARGATRGRKKPLFPGRQGSYGAGEQKTGLAR